MAKYEKGVSVKEIARERIGILLGAAEENRSSPSVSARYVALARAISMKQRVRFTKEQRRSFCRRCGAYFVPGDNLSVRVLRGRVIYTCKSCGAVYRFPLSGGETPREESEGIKYEKKEG
ncbi:MAG: ribonuclease P protein component 4 [Methanocorpusculum sp.]|nr:ribonuclease P protein component 4 [Methanocorpusculum sp.]